MTQEVRIRHGIKLVRRKCKRKNCPSPPFWVPENSKSKHCSIDCQLDDGVQLSQWLVAKIRGALI